MDTPWLRQQYWNLVRATTVLVPGLDAAGFRDEAQEFLTWTGLRPTPSNWVSAAAEVNRQYVTLRALEEEMLLLQRQEQSL